MKGIKSDGRGIDTEIVIVIAEVGAWMMRHTEMPTNQINHELALRGELARMIGSSRARQTLQ